MSQILGEQENRTYSTDNYAHLQCYERELLW